MDLTDELVELADKALEERRALQREIQKIDKFFEMLKEFGITVDVEGNKVGK